MLGDLFGDEEENDFGFIDTSQAAAVQANVQTWNYQSRPAHCASKLDPPSLPRQESNIVGLFNQ